MKIRTKAFLQITMAIGIMAGIAYGLEYLSPKYGFIIYTGIVAAYILYCLFNIRVSQLEYEQNRIIDELKK